MMKLPYWLRVLIALDRLANVILFGRLGETVSARAGRACRAGKRWGKTVCGILSWFQDDHCAVAIELDRRLAEELLELEGGD